MPPPRVSADRHRPHADRPAGRRPPDGSFVPYELWAIPLLYSANHAGDCWFFPRLAELERVLQKHLGIPYGRGLHVSPTLFTRTCSMPLAARCSASWPACWMRVKPIAGRYCCHAHRHQEGKQRFVPRMTPELDCVCRRAWCTDA